jgi:hypothetical protein
MVANVATNDLPWSMSTDSTHYHLPAVDLDGTCVSLRQRKPVARPPIFKLFYKQDRQRS